MLQMNAGSAIYGGLVIQGQIKVNGTSAVIYDGNVLKGCPTQTRTGNPTAPCAPMASTRSAI